MSAWLTDLQHLLAHGEIAVLVTVVQIKGDAPCDPGTKMLVTRENTRHTARYTLGGGHLDQQAIHIARQMLRDSPRNPAHPHLRRLERLASACAGHSGGALTLAFERLDAGDLGWLASLARRLAAGTATVRSVPFSVSPDGAPGGLSGRPPSGLPGGRPGGPFNGELPSGELLRGGLAGGELLRGLPDRPPSRPSLDKPPGEPGGPLNGTPGGPLGRPLDEPLGEPLNGPLNEPLNGLLHNPLHGQLNGPRGGSLSGSSGSFSEPFDKPPNAPPPAAFSHAPSGASSLSSHAESRNRASDAHHAHHANGVTLYDPEPGASAPDCLLWRLNARTALLTETIAPSEFPVVLFGVNHVSAALVRVLGTLPCRVHWVDKSGAAFAAPEALPALTTTPAFTAQAQAFAASTVPGASGAPGAHVAAVAPVAASIAPATHVAHVTHVAHMVHVAPASSVTPGAASAGPAGIPALTAGATAFTSGIAHLTIEATDTPVAAIDAAPAGASFIVMTHDHALDFALAERILRRGDHAFFGMLGSHAKRGQLERQLALRGLDPLQIARMHCPVGIEGITGKSPEIVALAVAAQWLQAMQAAQPQAAQTQTQTAQAQAAPMDAQAPAQTPAQAHSPDQPDPLCPA